MVHSLGDKVLKKSASLAFTPMYSCAAYLGKKQVTPHSGHLVVRKSLHSVSSAPHPFLEWLCSCSFEVPNGTLSGRVCALRQLHIPLHVLLFVGVVYCRVQARVLWIGCISWVEFCTSLPESHCIPLMLPLSWEVIFVVKLLATQPVEGLYLTLS